MEEGAGAEKSSCHRNPNNRVFGCLGNREVIKWGRHASHLQVVANFGAHIALSASFSEWPRMDSVAD